MEWEREQLRRGARRDSPGIELRQVKQEYRPAQSMKYPGLLPYDTTHSPNFYSSSNHSTSYVRSRHVASQFIVNTAYQFSLLTYHVDDKLGRRTSCSRGQGERDAQDGGNGRVETKLVQFI